jgi:CheY-like chemotaxis protein
MPICYFPTTVYFVDDDIAFLDQLKIRLKRQLIIKTESDPVVALNFFNNEYHQNAYWSRCFTKTKLVFGKPQELILDVSVITNEVYNRKRFEETANIVVDYAMPGLTGLELCKQVKRTDHMINPVLKLTFLTGKMDSAFDVHEYIDAFYRKSDPTEKLIQKMLSNERVFFEDASLGVMHHLVNDPTNRTVCLIDKVFIAFLKKLMADHNIVEHFLLDKQASFLMLDRFANLSWFLIRNDRGMNQSIEWAKQHSAPQGVIHALERREKLLYIPDEKQFKADSVDWNDYLHPIQVLEGQEKFYHAFVTDLKHHNIDRSRILSFDEYLKSV